MNRHLARVMISKAFLAELLKARGIEPGETIISSLPEDAEVVQVQEVDPFTFQVYIASDHFDEIGSSGEIPEFHPTFTRVSAVKTP